MRNKFLYAALLCLGACNPVFYNGTGQPLAKMTFDHIKPYSINVASYEPLDNASPTILPETFIVDPAKVAFEYLNARFNAVGYNGKLKIVIESSDISHKLVAPENSLYSALPVDIGKQDHYLIRLVLKLYLYGKDSDISMQTTLIAHRNIYIPEFASVVEREQAQMEAIDMLIDDLDKSISQVLSNNFALF